MKLEKSLSTARVAGIATLSLCLLHIPLLAGAAANQTVNGVTWSDTYDGDVVPAQASPAWTVASGGAGTGTANSDGSVLSLKSGVGSPNALSYQVGSAAGWNGQLGNGDSTVEARLRLISWDTGGATGTVAQSLKTSTGLREFQLGFRPCDVSFAGGSSYALDTTQFHTYRIVITNGISASLYVDGSSVPALVHQNAVTTSANLLRFGDITSSGAGEVVWDHLRWTNQGGYVPAAADAFGTRQLYPTLDGGREWSSNWGNGIARNITSGSRDPHDAEFIMRGTGSLTIDGQGIATMSGSSPRMYVYDEAKMKKWSNVEVTFYAMRVTEASVVSSQGFVSGTRSDHQDQSSGNPNPCTHTYYGRMLYDGRINFQKEFVHPTYSQTRGEVEVATTPANVWIGYKFVVRTLGGGGEVTLAIYRDLTDGQNGGTWEPMTEYDDVGTWDAMAACPGGISTAAITVPGTSTFVRNDGLGEARYKKFSVREIYPD